MKSRTYCEPTCRVNLKSSNFCHALNSDVWTWAFNYIFLENCLDEVLETWFSTFSLSSWQSGFCARYIEAFWAKHAEGKFRDSTNLRRAEGFPWRTRVSHFSTDVCSFFLFSSSICRTVVSNEIVSAKNRNVEESTKEKKKETWCCFDNGNACKTNAEVGCFSWELVRIFQLVQPCIKITALFGIIIHWIQ